MTLSLTNKITIAILAAVTIIGVSWFYSSNAGSENILNEIGGMERRYIADFSDERNILGAAHNAFVAKIIEKQEHTTVDGLPVTLFKAEVMHNIKGNLEGTVTVLQEVGYVETEEGSVRTGLHGNSTLMKEGETYLLATRYDKEKNIYFINSHPNAFKLLSDNANLKKHDLQDIIENNQTVERWEEAYKNENLLEYDVMHNNAQNSYQSLQEKE